MLEQFTPLPAALGGLLIGAAAALLIVANGRVAGISGILGGLPEARAGDRTWRVAFLLGLLAAPLLALGAGLVPGNSASPATMPVLIAAGLLVGYGTRLGNGCTSGHGVCGVARLSPRSLAATGTFMAAGALTVFLVRHLIGG